MFITNIIFCKFRRQQFRSNKPLEIGNQNIDKVSRKIKTNEKKSTLQAFQQQCFHGFASVKICVFRHLMTC